MPPPSPLWPHFHHDKTTRLDASESSATSESRIPSYETNSIRKRFTNQLLSEWRSSECWRKMALLEIERSENLERTHLQTRATMPTRMQQIPTSENMPKNLVRQAQISQEEDAHEDLPISLPIPQVPQPVHPQPSSAAAPSSTSTTCKTQIKLADLFNYTLDSTVGAGLGFYWPGSVKNLEEDLLAHERAAAEANTPASPPSTL